MITDALGIEVVAWASLVALAAAMVLAVSAMTWTWRVHRAEIALRDEAYRSSMTIQRALTLAHMGLFDAALRVLRGVPERPADAERAQETMP